MSAFLDRRPAYLIQDMAKDAAGLVEHLDLGGVHVVGVSMGGCISQALALAHPELVRSLTSMSSSTGSATSRAPNSRPPWSTRNI